MLRSRLLILAWAIGAGSLTSCGGGHRVHGAGSAAEPKLVTVANADRREVDVLFRAAGTVRGRNTALLTSKTIAHVREVSVRAGDVVTAGQELVRLDAKEVEASVRHAQAGLAESQAAHAGANSALSGAESELALAKTTRDRALALLDKGAITQQAFDEIDTRYRAAVAAEAVAKSRLLVATSGIEGAKAGLAEAKATLDFSRIVAPFAGRVIERKVDPGSLASPGNTLLVVEQEGALRVEAPVDELRGASIAIGDAAVVELDPPRGPVSAVVSEIVPSIDVASRAFLVKVDLPTTVTGLRPGMFARVAYHVGRRSPVVVPPSGISSSGALDRVFVVEDGHARLRIVTLGERAFPNEPKPWVEILSGLGEGEKIVNPIPLDLRDGAPVKVGP